MSTTSTYGEPGTRRRILDAAWHLLEERGTGVSLGEVAKAAGVSRQAIYLHFNDRPGLFVALMDHIDVSLGAVELRRHIHSGASGVEDLERWVDTMSWYTARINTVTLAVESHRQQDDALAAAWEDRMSRRREHLRAIVGRIAFEGRLAPGWTVETAVDMTYAVTLPGPWRELTGRLGWSGEEYRDRVMTLLGRALLSGASVAGKPDDPYGVQHPEPLDTVSSTDVTSLDMT